MQKTTSLESLFQLVHLFKRHLHQQIEALNLDITPMHIRVMKVINKTSSCTAIDIANKLNRDKAQVTRLLNILIQQSLISKEPHPTDKRSQCLQLTLTGIEVMNKITEIDKNITTQMIKDISPEELELFESISQKINRNLYQ